ncbi:MAG: hypothetical protein HDQ96_03590 [Lachnospiraceae bacterium]|nr:hypothetical protein [Lachnospiraceae bacterium]
MTIEISLLLSGISVAFAIYFGLSTKRRNEKNDARGDQKDAVDKAKKETENDTLVMIKLENIANDIKEIKSENRDFREDISALRERVAKVESSLKSYHKRLDGEIHPEE